MQIADNAGKGSALRQVVAAFVSNLGSISIGMVFGFSATALPQLKSPGSTIPITDDQASWIASLSAASNPIGCIFSGCLMDHIGRRCTLIVTEVPFIAGWLLIAFAPNVWSIYLGRLLIGLAAGMMAAPARVYTCEVTQPYLRGVLAGLASVGVSAGVLLSYVIGSLTSWNTQAGISVIIPLFAVIGMLFLPETPNYLLTRGRADSALKSLAKLRGSKCNLNEEIQRMIAFKEKNRVQPLKGVKQTMKALLSPSAVKPLTMLAIYFWVYQWGGINTITFYTVEVFEDSGAPFDKYWLTVWMGVIRLIFTIVGCVLSSKCGARPLTFVSAIGCGVTMIILAIYMYFLKLWQDNGTAPSYSWIPVTSIFIFVVTCSIGYFIVPWTMTGEIFPTQVRGILGGMSTFVNHVAVFSVVKTYPSFKKQFDLYKIFGFYGLISIFGIIFFYFFLPETKGRSLNEIEDYYSGRTKTLQKNSTTGNT